MGGSFPPPHKRRKERGEKRGERESGGGGEEQRKEEGLEEQDMLHVQVPCPSSIPNKKFLDELLMVLHKHVHHPPQL